MQNEALIAETGRLLASLPEAQARSVRDFAAFLAQQVWAQLPLVEAKMSDDETEEEFAADVQAIQQHSKSFDFLHDEPDLYSADDSVERYHLDKPS